MTRYYDNSRTSEHRDCPRAYFFRYVRHMQKSGVAMPLLFGTCWHDAMDVVWQRIAGDRVKDRAAVIDEAYEAFVNRWVTEGLTHPDDIGPGEIDAMQPRTPMTAFEMLVNYVEIRQQFLNSIKLHAVEQPFAVPLWPDKDDIFYVGRLDKVYETAGGSWWVGEHKTTTAYKKDGFFKHDFVEQFSPNSQIDGYMYAGNMLYGKQFKGVMVDAALVHKTVHEGFGLLPQPRQLSALDSWLFDARSEISRISYEEDVQDSLDADMDRSKQLTAMPSFPRNTTKCCGKYGICQYIDICKVVDNPIDLGIPQGFVESKWEPVDFETLNKLGLAPETDTKEAN